MYRAGRRTLLVACLLLCALGGAGVTVTAEDGTNATGQETVGNATLVEPPDAGASLPEGQYDSHDSIVLTQEFRLTPDEPGQIDVQWQFRVPDRVSDVKTRLPEDATNVRTDRFTRDGDVYEWPADTSTATITFTMPANETSTAVGPESAGGRLKFVDAGDWALTRRPPVAKPGYRYRGDNPGVTIRNATAGEGVVGDALLYLGPHETVERRAHDQRFRLVVPEAADLAADRSAILDSVTDASDRLRVGDRDRQVLMVAAPTSVSWGQRGLQTGERDFYVLADEELDTPENSWVHEYVHTRQGFETTDGTQWLYEATAEYYAALLTLEQDRIDFPRFQRKMESGTARQFDDVRLIDPSTYRSNGGNYIVGALVSGELDRRIRVVTDSGATFGDVLRRVNRADEPVRRSMFIDSVRSAGGSGVVDPAGRFTETTERPEPWDQSAHQEAFGALPARFAYSLPDRGSDGVRVRSEYREGQLGETGLVAGETLVLDVAVENLGGSAGEYDLAVTVDGQRVAERTGRLDADATATETVEHTFEGPGSYTLSTGEDSRTVRVREPAPPVVTDLVAAQEGVGPGESVTLTATVENPADRPADGTVAITRDGEEVTSERVGLAPGGSADVTASVSLSEPGTYQFEAGERSVTVTVREPETATPTPTSTPTATAADTEGGNDNTGASGPGFGLVVALLALALSLLLGKRVQ
jgi:hypothetical protein